DYALALRGRGRVKLILEDVLRRFDLLALPTVPWPPGLRSDTSPVAAERALLTFLFNLSGQPAISVPCGFTSAGMPIGLQLAAGAHQEARLLGSAAAYERATPWSAKHPSSVDAEATVG